MDGRRVEYEGGRIEKILDNSNNLKEVENLESLDYILITNLMY